MANTFILCKVRLSSGTLLLLEVPKAYLRYLMLNLRYLGFT
jgi:hypothetical protein